VGDHQLFLEFLDSNENIMADGRKDFSVNLNVHFFGHFWGKFFLETKVCYKTAPKNIIL
jgi:hypothetical protein